MPRTPTPEQFAQTGLIHHALRPLYKRATRDNLRFQSRMDPTIVYTPQALAFFQAQGLMLWGPCNWKLVK